MPFKKQKKKGKIYFCNFCGGKGSRGQWKIFSIMNVLLYKVYRCWRGRGEDFLHGGNKRFLGVFVLVVPASRLKHRPITREEVTTSLHRDAEKPKEAVDWFDILKKMLMRITKKGEKRGISDGFVSYQLGRVGG